MLELDPLRMLFAFLCGYFLTLSGSLTQITLNNSLASPSTLGFDALAALCVILAQSLLVFAPFAFALEHFSFGLFMALLGACSLLFLRTGQKGGLKSEKAFSLDIKFLILAGLAFNLFVGAVFSVIQFLFMAMNYDFPSGLWFGNFRFYHGSSLGLFIFAFVLSQVFLYKTASSLRLLSLGEKVALGFGVPVAKIQKSCLVAALLMTGLVISYFGVFSFLSLIAPHMLRSIPYFKENMRHELFMGALLGGAALAFLDALCFVFDYRGAELPAGMVSSVAGALLLIALLWKSRLKNQA